jgi:hypothetical protein
MAGVFAAVGESPSPLNFARVLSRQLPTQTFKSMLEAGKLDKCTGKCNGDADVCKMSTLEEDIAKRVERFHAFAARAQELSLVSVRVRGQPLRVQCMWRGRRVNGS